MKKLFDGHIHLFPDAPEVSVTEMEKEGAEKWAVLSCSQYYADPAQNIATLYAKALAPERCFAYFSFDYPRCSPQRHGYEDQLTMWLDAGCDGLKLLETKPDCAKLTGVRLDAPEFEPVFARCEKEQIPIVWHVGDPANFWDPETCPPWAKDNGWAYTDGSFLTLKELYDMTENVLNRHPNLKAALAHFYFVSDDPAHAQRMMDDYPNLRFDLTPGVEMFDGFTKNSAFFRPFIGKYADRLFFGSDCEVHKMEGRAAYTESVAERFFRTGDAFRAWNWDVKGFDYPEDTLDRLFCSSAEAFHGSAPRPINKDAALYACDETLAMLEAEKSGKLEMAKAMRSRIAGLL